jgi:hypothetical protein
MAIYKHPSWIYFNDNEFFELLSNLGHRELLKVARSRGFVFSEKADDSSVRSAMSLLPSNWPLVSHIYETIAKPDPAERKSTVHVTNCAPDNDIAAIAGSVRDERTQKNDEIYTITQESPESVRITVAYIDTDLTKALQYSRRERSVEIEAIKEGGKISFIHDASDKARAVVKQLEKQIKPALEQNVKVEVISLQTIRDPALRTRFFTEILKGVADHVFVSTSNVVIEHRLPSEEAEKEAGSPNDEKDAEQVAEKVKGIINRIAISGEQVLAATLYQQAADSGYFITQLTWTMESKAESGKFVDFVAGFGDPIACEQFSSDVCKRWQWSADNPDKAEVLSLTTVDRRSLNTLIQASADKAYTTVRVAHEKKASKKSGAK